MQRSYKPQVCIGCKRTMMRIGDTAPYCRRCSSERVSRALSGERVELTDVEAQRLQLNYRVRRFWEDRARRAT